MAQDESTAGKYFWIVNIPDNSRTFILDHQSLLKLMDTTKGSPDVRQELLNRLLPGKNGRLGCNGYLPYSENKVTRKSPQSRGLIACFLAINPR